MKKLFFVVLLCTLLPLGLVNAQDEVQPGEGLPIVEGNSSGSINIGSLNPLRCLATDCATVTSMLFPTLIGVDFETGYYAPDAQDGLALDWSVSEDGLEYTFTLRQDLTWTDGEPITAEDVAFSMNAILSDEIESTISANVIGTVTGVEALDDYTVKFTFAESACTALGDVNIPVVPAHVFESFVDMVDNSFDRDPSVSSGVFSFLGTEAGERVALQANQEYKWAPNGVIPQGWIYLDVPSTTVEVERFLAGELNLISVPSENRSQFRNNPDFQTFEYPANSWSYIGLNLADPANPQPAMDADGNPIDQGYHPLFGDNNVRRAIQHAIDVQGLIEGALFGEGVQMASYELPTSWALDPDLAPVAFDPEAAGAMLDAAGFPMGADGIRVADDTALYAEPGTRLSFELILEDSTESSQRTAALVQDQLLQVGIEVELNPLDFNTAIDLIGGQTYDAYLLGWSNSFPADPDFSAIFSAEADEPPFGFNDTSYANQKLFDLMEEARVLPGCDQETRAGLYHEIQSILQADQPYIWLFTSTVLVASSADVQNFNPYPNATRWNIHEWVRSQ